MYPSSEEVSSRRNFNKSLLSGLISYALLDTALATQALGRSMQADVAHWSVRLNEYCQDLRTESLTVAEWQEHVETLFSRVRLRDLLVFLDFELFQKGFKFTDQGVRSEKISLPRIKGLPKKTAFKKQIYGMKKGCAIIPHGHSNMVSAHVVLQGEIHARHYDKLALEDAHMIIQPSSDNAMTAGTHSSISDGKDNVHWFVANTDACFMFDVILLNLHERSHSIHNLDIYELEKLPEDKLRVPIIDLGSAIRKYGRI